MGDRLTARKTDTDPRLRKGWVWSGCVRPGLNVCQGGGSLIWPGDQSDFSEEEALGAELGSHLATETCWGKAFNRDSITKETAGAPAPWGPSPTQECFTFLDAALPTP